MELRESIKSALAGLLTNRLRSFLSMLGIIIGIAAVVAIIAISEGSQQMILENIQALGTNLISVSAGTTGGAAGSRRCQVPLREGEGHRRLACLRRETGRGGQRGRGRADLSRALGQERRCP